jgi:DNA polymerase III sliding clamp (beta) subunit (PCNA family)
MEAATKNQAEAVTAGRVVLDAKTAYAALDIAQSCAGRNLHRPALEAVRIYSREGSLIVAAADGFRLAEVTATLADGGEIDTLIPIESVLAALKAIKPYLKLTAWVTITDDMIGVGSEAGEARVPYAKSDATFPNYHELIPAKRAEDHSRFAVNAKFLVDLGKLTVAHSKTGIVRIQPGKDAKSPIRADFTNPEKWDAVIVLMPMFVDW